MIMRANITKQQSRDDHGSFASKRPRPARTRRPCRIVSMTTTSSSLAFVLACPYFHYFAPPIQPVSAQNHFGDDGCLYDKPFGRLSFSVAQGTTKEESKKGAEQYLTHLDWMDGAKWSLLETETQYHMDPPERDSALACAYSSNLLTFEFDKMLVFDGVRKQNNWIRQRVRTSRKMVEKKIPMDEGGGTTSGTSSTPVPTGGGKNDTATGGKNDTATDENTTSNDGPRLEVHMRRGLPPSHDKEMGEPKSKKMVDRQNKMVGAVHGGGGAEHDPTGALQPEHQDAAGAGPSANGTTTTSGKNFNKRKKPEAPRYRTILCAPRELRHADHFQLSSRKTDPLSRWLVQYQDSECLSERFLEDEAASNTDLVSDASVSFTERRKRYVNDPDSSLTWPPFYLLAAVNQESGDIFLHNQANNHFINRHTGELTSLDENKPLPLKIAVLGDHTTGALEETSLFQHLYWKEKGFSRKIEFDFFGSFCDGFQHWHCKLLCEMAPSICEDSEREDLFAKHIFHRVYRNEKSDGHTKGGSREDMDYQLEHMLQLFDLVLAQQFGYSDFAELLKSVAPGGDNWRIGVKGAEVDPKHQRLPDLWLCAHPVVPCLFLANSLKTLNSVIPNPLEKKRLFLHFGAQLLYGAPGIAKEHVRGLHLRLAGYNSDKALEWLIWAQDLLFESCRGFGNEKVVNSEFALENADQPERQFEHSWFSFAFDGHLRPWFSSVFKGAESLRGEILRDELFEEAWTVIGGGLEEEEEGKKMGVCAKDREDDGESSGEDSCTRTAPAASEGYQATTDSGTFASGDDDPEKISPDRAKLSKLYASPAQVLSLYHDRFKLPEIVTPMALYLPKDLLWNPEKALYARTEHGRTKVLIGRSRFSSLFNVVGNSYFQGLRSVLERGLMLRYAEGPLGANVRDEQAGGDHRGEEMLSGTTEDDGAEMNIKPPPTSIEKNKYKVHADHVGVNLEFYTFEQVANEYSLVIDSGTEIMGRALVEFYRIAIPMLVPTKRWMFQLGMESPSGATVYGVNGVDPGPWFESGFDLAKDVEERSRKIAYDYYADSAIYEQLPYLFRWDSLVQLCILVEELVGYRGQLNDYHVLREASRGMIAHYETWKTVNAVLLRDVLDTDWMGML